jgi:hypothetical protein
MNKKFLRMLCLTLAAVSTLSLFAGCGGTTDSSTGGGSTDDGKTAAWRNENNALVFS